MKRKIPLRKGGKGVVKLPRKTQPPESPFIKGDYEGLIYFLFLLD